MINGEKYHVSKNLLSYDYLFSNDYSRESEYFRYYQLNLKPNTQYTIKTDYITATHSSNLEPPLMFGLSNVMSGAVDGVFTDVAKTITTGSDGIAFLARRIKSQFGDIYVISYDKLTNGTYYIMINEGSIAIPYEPYGDIWTDVPIPTRKLHNATDIITSLPTDIYTEGQTIGANLFDKTDYVAGKYINNQGVEATSSSGISNHSDYISIVRNNSYTLSTNKPSYSGITYAVAWYDSSKNFIIRDSYAAADDAGRYSYTFTAPSNAVYAIFNFTLYPDYDNEQIMFNSGNSALPYQPYTPAIIKGNMAQSGTPTPTTPITPSECGDRTENLFDISTQTVGYLVRAGNTGSSKPLGNIEQNAAYNLSAYIEVLPNTLYTIKYPKASIVSGAGLVYYSDNSGTTISGIPLIDQGQTYTFTTPNDCNYIRFSYDNTEGTDVMLNTGSTALTYQPYGYVLSVKSGNTTTPVYLGEVQSTRKIVKKVFDGTETWSLLGRDTGRTVFSTPITTGATECLCSHIEYKETYTTELNRIVIPAAKNALYISIDNTIISQALPSETDFKTYLAQQYSAGTPVCVWYVLATPETAVVNEPLRKIGDYADSVTATNIPTTSGGIEFDVLTSLKPSEVDLTYHGWHDISPEQYENGAWN